MLLTAKIKEIGEKQVVVSVEGSMTLGSSLKVLDAQLQNLIANGANRIVIDLAEVDFIDSAGLGLLMLARGLLNKSGSMLRLCSPQARVRALFKMTKTDTLLRVDDSLGDSLEAIRS